MRTSRRSAVDGAALYAGADRRSTRRHSAVDAVALCAVADRRGVHVAAAQSMELPSRPLRRSARGFKRD
jgi:hypothetical protein